VTCQPIVGLRNRAFLVSCPLNASLRGRGSGVCSVSPRSAGGGRAGRGDVTRVSKATQLPVSPLRDTSNSGRDVYSSLLSNRQRNSNWFSGNRREGYISSATNITRTVCNEQFYASVLESSPTSQLLRGVLQEVNSQRELKTLRVRQCVIISDSDGFFLLFGL
jgi:hypothetical protein